MGGPCTCLVYNGHLTVQLVRELRRELQPEGGKQAPVVIGEEPRRRRHLGYGSIVRPQEKQRFHLPVPQPGGLTGVHPVQGHRDGTHVILGQDQLEELGKFLQLHGLFPQQPGALFQPAAEDLPKLSVFLRPLELSPRAQPF